MGAAELRPHRGKGLSQICPRPKPADASGESGSFWITGFSLGGHLFPGVQDHTVGPGRLEENSPSQPVSLLLTPAPRGQGGWGPAGSRGGWIHTGSPQPGPGPAEDSPPPRSALGTQVVLAGQLAASQHMGRQVPRLAHVNPITHPMVWPFLKIGRSPPRGGPAVCRPTSP